MVTHPAPKEPASRGASHAKRGPQSDHQNAQTARGARSHAAPRSRAACASNATATKPIQGRGRRARASRARYRGGSVRAWRGRRSGGIGGLFVETITVRPLVSKMLVSKSQHHELDEQDFGRLHRDVAPALARHNSRARAKLHPGDALCAAWVCGSYGGATHKPRGPTVYKTTLTNWFEVIQFCHSPSTKLFLS